LVTVYPNVRIVGVELDAAVLAVARSRFGIASLPRIRLVDSDARWFLQSTRERYDVIAVDLFVGGQVPFFCATKEFFELVRTHLTEDGVMMMNVFSRRGDQLIAPVVRTVAAVFPSVSVIGEANAIVTASRKPSDLAAVLDGLDRRIASPPELRQVIRRARLTVRSPRPGAEWPIFTDDRNDIEFRVFDVGRGGR